MPGFRRQGYHRQIAVEQRPTCGITGPRREGMASGMIARATRGQREFLGKRLGDWGSVTSVAAQEITLKELRSCYVAASATRKNRTTLDHYRSGISYAKKFQVEMTERQLGPRALAFP